MWNIIQIIKRKFLFVFARGLANLVMFGHNNYVWLRIFNRKVARFFGMVNKYGGQTLPLLFSHNLTNFRYENWFDKQKFSGSEPDFSKVYLASNDKLPELNFNGGLFLGVANLDGFNLLSQKNQKDTIFYDINEQQLLYLYCLHRLVLQCETPLQFLGCLFSRDVTGLTQIDLSKASLDDLFWQLPSSQIKLKNIDPFLEKLINTLQTPQDLIRNENDKIVGVRFFSKTSVIGDFEPMISLSEYKGKSGQQVLSFVREKGFLFSQSGYDVLKKNLSMNSTLYVGGGISTNLLQTLFSLYKYEKISLWTSNIFSPYFYYREVRKSFRCILETIIFKQGPEIELLVDQRRKFVSQKNFYPITNHKFTFRSILPYLSGSGVEIVVKKDKNYSYFPNFDYYSFAEFKKIIDDVRPDTVFFHLLLSEGIDIHEVLTLFEKVRSNGRVIVLEHNEGLVDAMTDCSWITIYGKPDDLIDIPEANNQSKIRNRLLLYDPIV